MPEDNRAAIREVFDRHFDELYGYVAWRLAPDQASAQDVVQEVFLAAMQGWDAYRGDGPVLSWLRAIARHKVADYFQQRGKLNHHIALDTLSEAVAFSDDGNPQRRALLLAEAMRRLPDESVELLEEKYIERLSVRQMAAQHARSAKAIESALSRAREKLRTTFLHVQRQQEV